MASTPLIINAAISGSLSKHAMPNLPKDAEDIGRMAVEVWRAGASIVHIEADPVPETVEEERPVMVHRQ